ncbi:MAG TPA: choice-of-anchor L domain-containing protein [Solirubrobacteraceae bacterium]|nr:choice-of-anchor L domain-containing protein [Solirubrobacteraceae bacterium]
MRRLVLAVLIAAVAAAPASAAVTPTRSAKKVARAMVAKPGLLRGARFVKLPPQGKPAAVATTRLAGFRPHRRTFGVLSTGDATLLDDPDEQDDLSTDNAGSPYRGAAADAVVLRLDLRAPRRANCLSFSFRFLSEEYDEFVDTEFNDAFLAELRRSTWRSEPADPRVRAPRNFARDRRRLPISVNGTGDFAVDERRAAGTTYDGATRTLRAARRVRPGRRRHRLFLSIFDQGDHQYDSSVVVDRLRIDRRRRCRSGR